ncbi:hypothetical protein DMN91_005189 [Ooceraea biroi]|nr:uncharacterized protein LOC105285202 isoform X4 [Ooceraea biroi]XP_011347565.1 uncharacterized protein LOC105285202 isoform X4 [Ooceraea biroi]XP_011347566.1 uncharacterized protein LOC105285202 isoform X4 [Ooceraea biroi]RLU22911.1 hypothetical protein DMN91_005189 [Ooceraea biroi]
MLLEYLINNWKYTNAPEGKRPFEKIVGLLKFGVPSSFLMGAYDCVIISHTQTVWSTANCMAYWMVPVNAMCVTFASVAYASARIRQKDDYTNYALASLACGGIIHHWMKNGFLSCYFTVALLICAKIKKHNELLGIEPLPMGYSSDIINRQYEKYPDFTLTKDPRGRRPWE